MNADPQFPQTFLSQILKLISAHRADVYFTYPGVFLGAEDSIYALLSPNVLMMLSR